MFTVYDVSTHSRLKAAGTVIGANAMESLVSTHSRLKAAGEAVRAFIALHPVSTHSRLKAAGESGLSVPYLQRGFNTQPPEGGWLTITMTTAAFMFQHTAA